MIGSQDLGGVRLFVGLLGRPEESLRLLGLRLLLSFVPLLPAEPIMPQQAGSQVCCLAVQPRICTPTTPKQPHHPHTYL